MMFKPLLWIGTISYGIYVYHMIIKTSWDMVPALHWSQSNRALAVGAISILIAAVSFYVYEKPINGLKRYFSYRAQSPGKENFRGN